MIKKLMTATAIVMVAGSAFADVTIATGKSGGGYDKASQILSHEQNNVVLKIML